MSKIIIVGGGSAGWMTAATLISQFPQHKITVIESPNTPTVGVGESTLQPINLWMNLIGLKDEDWMAECDASYKLSIRFENFYQKNDGGFHYPFGNPLPDKWKWFYRKDVPKTNFVDYNYPIMSLVNNNTICENGLPNYSLKENAAYHFDATKFGIWLKEKFCILKGVQYISEDITSIETNENGIESLNKRYTADLYIDCTGFKSLLMNKLEVPFVSYSDMLPNNSAWATRIPYTNKEEELKPYTNCTALNNGWVWNIPLWSRIGTGYVYSDKYISDEDALQEFKDYLGRDDVEFRKLKMRVGIHEKIFEKNVCAIGLSAGFIEPLESNGLFSVHEFLIQLVKILRRTEDITISEWDRYSVNKSCRIMFDDFATFVAMHYTLSHRTDTEYWRDNFKRLVDNENFKKNVEVKMDRFKLYDDDKGIGCISVGMNYPMIDVLWDDIDCLDDIEIRKKEMLEWDSFAKSQPTLFEFLRSKYYS